jgi:hypothetical protein
MKSLGKSLCALLVPVLMIVLVCTVQATTESINVQAGADVVRTIDLASEDRVILKFSAVGDAPSTLHFWVKFANGTKVDYGEISGREMSFASGGSGQFTMHFDNLDSSSSKLVTLNYEVERYYFGIPGMLFILIAIAVFLVGIVAGYIVMGKYA